MQPSASTTSQPVLAHDDARARFDTWVVPMLLAELKRSAEPKAIVVVGEPGAGHHAAAARIRKSLQAEGNPPVVIDTDDLEQFHTRYRELDRQLGPAELSAELRHHVCRWLLWSVERAAKEKASIIVVDRDNDPELFTAVVDALHGLRVEVAVLAVPPEVCELADLEQRQLRVEHAGAAPLDLPHHPHRYRGYFPICARIDETPAVARVGVFPTATSEQPTMLRTREGQSWLNTGLSGTPVEAPVATADLVRIETDRQWTPAEYQAWQLLRLSMTARLGRQWQPYLAELNRHASRHRPRASPARPSAGTALIFGRFQVFTTLDLLVVHTAIEKFPHATVCVIDETRLLDRRRPTDRFHLEMAIANDPANNPLTVNERVAMVQAAISAAGLDRRVSVGKISRPDVAPIDLPSHAAVFVRLDPEGAETSEFHQRNWVRILEVPVVSVTAPPFHTVNPRVEPFRGTQAPELPWMPEGAREVFMAIGGPDRVLRGPEAAVRIEPLRDETQAGDRVVVTAIDHVMAAAAARLDAEVLPAQTGLNGHIVKELHAGDIGTGSDPADVDPAASWGI
ncbi:zeta toxin family protein [Nocardia asteroides]|uniref:zeta toxin family protein n=1 Tax=Nocardia asteroides TaxID=1824 RepID=UPI0037C5ED51